MMHRGGVGTTSNYMADPPDEKMWTRKVGQSSRAVLLVTSGCLCYNCVFLFAVPNDWGFEKIGMHQTQGELALNTVYNIVLFTNAASDVILIFSIYFSIIGILKMFIAWNAVTIFLCWVAACIQVHYRYSQVVQDAGDSPNGSLETRGPSVFTVNEDHKPHEQDLHFWSVLVLVTAIASVRALVLVCFYLSYLSKLEQEAEATPALSPDPSSNSVVDPRNPWRWFQIKRRPASSGRSLHVPSDGRQSRRNGAGSFSLLGWLTPNSWRSVVTSSEPTPGPGPPRPGGLAKTRSRGVTGGASSLASGVTQPATLYDPAELRSPSGLEDPHEQSACAMHVVPNLGRISYIWHQSSSKAEIPASSSSRERRLPSSSSFEAMQIAELGGGLGPPHVKHFEDPARYDPCRSVLSTAPDVVADEGHDLECPAEDQPEQLAQQVSPNDVSVEGLTRGVLFSSSRPLSLPSVGFYRTGGSDQQTGMATSGQLAPKAPVVSRLKRWHECVPRGSTSSRAIPPGQDSHRLLSVPQERPIVLDPKQVSFGVAIAEAATPPGLDGTKEAENEAKGRRLLAQEVCGWARTNDDANNLQQDDPGRAAESTSAAETSKENSNSVREQRTQPVMGRRETQPFINPQVPTIWCARRSGAFLFSSNKVATRDSAQQTDS
ncbi:uncharacterized protein LOC142584306 isoform X2 [Dermacentor variabilis]|uniref:uncharacterized protein LOC142584306 isoform X2 n=1 Tax=Dermacentor variabilis TaxID=34621 RepID=UPI003F5B59D9